MDLVFPAPATWTLGAAGMHYVGETNNTEGPINMGAPKGCEQSVAPAPE